MNNTFTKNRVAKTSNKPIDSLCSQVVASCNEAKAEDIVILDLEGVSDVAKYYVIVTARSDRQCQGISNRVIDELSKEGSECYCVSGYENGHWIIVDYIDTVLHIFYGEDREKYDLEGLWNKARRISGSVGMNKMAA